MSETIILIMTSSSTRNTEPRGGRVGVMRSVLAHLAHRGSQKSSVGATIRWQAPECNRLLRGAAVSLIRQRPQRPAGARPVPHPERAVAKMRRTLALHFVSKSPAGRFAG